MKVKALIVVMSHLSDAQEKFRMFGKLDAHDMYNDINFAKYVIHKTNGNLNQEIDADKLFDEYEKSIK
ncbi:MAG: hypothetical protein WC333_02095 [Dehalococcoidia bacterium]